MSTTPKTTPHTPTLTTPKRSTTGRIPTLPLTITLITLLLTSTLLSLTFGSEPIPLPDVWAVTHAWLTNNTTTNAYDVIITELRMPRAILAAIVGAGLATAGATMQTLVRNPLADPYLLGVSSGAAVGATAVITWGTLAHLGIYALSAGALLGALAAATLVYLVACAQGGLTPVRLILSGVVLSSAFSAIASLMVFLSDDNRSANSVMFWMLGSLSGATWTKIWLPAIIVTTAITALCSVHSWLDALAAGPETATALGVNVKALRTALFIGLGVLIGVLVAVSGGIGFVGLIIPHAARLCVGATHRLMLPVAALGGGVFLIWVDIIARVVARPQELPLGVVTGIIGAPLFLLLMGRRSYGFGGQK